jgi:hypothetical protein
MKAEQKCKRIKNRVDLEKVSPSIDYSKAEVKKTGGFLFGFMARDELWVELMTNFTPSKVQRRSEDFDWLRQALIRKNVGAYVPPLEEYYTVEPEDKIGINNRVKAILQFMNSLTNYDYLIQCRYVHEFLSETDYKRFTLIRKKEEETKLVNEIGAAETIDGSFTAELSKRTVNLTRVLGKFSVESEMVYSSL